MIASVRAALRLGAIVLALVAALLLHMCWRLVRLPSPWPRLFLGAVGFMLGARRRVIGTPLRRDVVFAANHLSWMDIPITAGATGSAFVAMAELRQVPLIGWLSTLNHTIFVRREDRMGVALQVEQLRQALAQAWAITLFPEGTTGNGITLRPFKASLLAVLDPPPPGVLIQPLRIDYGAATSELAWIGDESGLAHALRVLRRPRSFTATLTFLDPFDPRTVGGRKQIAAQAAAQIAAAGRPAAASL